MDDGGQPSHSMIPFSNQMTREEYLLHKAQIDVARERLAKMALEIELHEAARRAQEAEQKLENMRAAAAAAAQSSSAGPSSASNSNHYPHANYQFEAVHEIPLTARIEGEVQDSPSDSSRPPVQVLSTHYNYQHNYPTIRQPQQASFQAYAPFSTQHPEWAPVAQTPAQAAARSRKKPSGYAPGSTSTIPRYQYPSIPSSSTPSYTYQTMRQNGQSYQQQWLPPGEEYWERQSQNYMAELAATGTQPTSSLGVNAQATLLSGSAIPQQPHVQHHMPLPAAQFEPADAVPSAQHPPSSIETQTLLNPQSSGNDLPNTAITKQEFIRRFQIVSEHDANLIRSFLSTTHVPVEWLTEAVSSVDPANLKDASAVAFLNDVRNRLKISPLPQSISSTSVGTDVRIPMVDDVPSKSPATSVQPPPPPADASSIQRTSTGLTKEKYLVSFNEILLRAGVDKAADFFLRNQLGVPREWQQALINSLTPEQVTEMHSAWNRAYRKALEAKARLASSSVAKKSDASPNDVPNIVQQNRNQTIISLNEVVTQPAPTKECPKPVPAPPRPSVTRSLQSTSAQPPKTSTAQSSKASTIPNNTTTTTFVASQSTSAPAAQISASTTTTAPLAPLMQPRIAISQPPTGTVTYRQAADNFRHYHHPPTSVLTGDGKHVEYVHDPYLNKYVRRDTANRLPNSSTSSRQQPSAVVPQGISASTQVQAIPQGVSASTQIQATISIPPATSRRRPNGTVTEGRTPQQADKSRLAKDILRSLGMDELPVMVTAEEEESNAEEGAGVLGNLPATTESQEEAAQSQDLAQLFQVAPQDTSLVLPPTLDQHPPYEARPIQSLPSDVPMESERQPPTRKAPLLPSDLPMEQGKQPSVQATQSPIKATIIDLTMDDETTTTAPGDGPTSLISPPPPAVASVPASTSPDQYELRRRVNEISPPKSPPLIAMPRAASVSMDQHDSAHGVNGISIAADMHRPESSQEGGHMDSSITFPTLDELPPPVSKLAGSSSPPRNFRLGPREQNEDIADEVLPLFLPSPSASPAPSEHSPLLPDTDDDVVIVDSMLRGDSPSRRYSDSDILGEGSLTFARSVRRKKAQRAYVLVPPPSPGLERAIRKKRKLEENGVVSGSEEEESKYNDFERAFMVDCRFRMAEKPCQWAGCDALMNSCENLYMHLKLHAQEASSQGLCICRWQSCPRKFKSAEAMEKHLQRHAYFPLPCPLENCSAVFDEPFDAIQHEVRQRTSTPNIGLKPPPNPYQPSLVPPKLDPPPHIIPAYRTEPRYIRTASITPQRHSVIGPWVLHNIFSPVEQNLRKQSGSMRFRYRYPRGDAQPEDLDNLRARPDEYDFLASLSIPPTRTIRYDDLDSEGTSLTLHEGIAFWDTMSESDGRPAKMNSAGEGDADLGEDMVMETTDGGASHSVLVEDSIMTDPDVAISTLDEMYGSQWTTGGGGEEEAVEMMLL